MVQWVIAEVMADHELEPDNIANEYRRHSVYGWGAFKCDECRVSWTSQITWATIDIKEQCIKRRFKQKCRSCEKPQRPWWHIQEFAYMVEFALNRYRKLIAGKWRPSARASKSSAFNPPHKSEFCERCGFGKSQCWIASQAEKLPTSKDKLDSEEIDTDMKAQDQQDSKTEPERKSPIKGNLKPRKNSAGKGRPGRRQRATTTSQTESDSQTKSESVSEEKLHPTSKSGRPTRSESESDAKRKSESEADAKDKSVLKSESKTRPRRRSERTPRPKSESNEVRTPRRNRRNDNNQASNEKSTPKNQVVESPPVKYASEEKAVHKDGQPVSKSKSDDQPQSKSELGDKTKLKKESDKTSPQKSIEKTPRKNEYRGKKPLKNEPREKVPRKSESGDKELPQNTEVAKPRKSEPGDKELPQNTEDAKPRKSESGDKELPQNTEVAKPRKSEPGDKELPQNTEDAKPRKSESGDKELPQNTEDAKPRKSESGDKELPQNTEDAKPRKSESGDKELPQNTEDAKLRKSESDEAVHTVKEFASKVQSSFDLKAKPQRPGRFTRRRSSGSVSKKTTTSVEGTATSNGDLSSKETNGANDSPDRNAQDESVTDVAVSEKGNLKLSHNDDASSVVGVKLMFDSANQSAKENEPVPVVEIKSLFENNNPDKESSILDNAAFDKGRVTSNEDISSVVEIDLLFESGKSVSGEADTNVKSDSSVLDVPQLSEIQVE